VEFCPVVQMRRVARLAVTGFVLSLAVAGLTGCRTSPTVAAYVGDEQISVTELENEVDRRLEQEDVAAAAEGNEDEFSRLVLSLLVEQEVYAEVAERYDVQVDEDDVRDRIAELFEGQDLDSVYAGLAERGLARVDVFENVHQLLLRLQIAEQEGLDEGLSEEALRARFEEVRESEGEQEFGLMLVPDQAIADAVVAQLNTDPASYPTLAAQYPGELTLATLEPRPLDDVPVPLQESVAAAEPNTAFSLPVPELNGVVVAFVGTTVYPTFEELRPTLEQEAESAVDDAATELVDQVREDLDVTVNPRYGQMQEGRIVAVDGGVVDILDGDGA
jgi:peptidyl-prolyl cis-trans isomerase SurA